MKKNKYNKINEILQIPQEICSKIPKMEIIGFNGMLIENFKGILEYEELYIKINTYIGILNINGYNLIIENISEDYIKISGNIDKIELERMIE